MDVAVLHRNEFKEDPLCFVNVLFHSKRKQTTAIQIDMYERYTTVSFFIWKDNMGHQSDVSDSGTYRICTRTLEASFNTNADLSIGLEV